MVSLRQSVKKNPVKRLGSPGVLVAQWLEHLTGMTSGRGFVSYLELLSEVPSLAWAEVISINIISMKIFHHV